jgi:hypothetical protein
MDRVLAERGIGQVDAIALDIGVSSMQLDRADRGFSFSADGPLDMRMSRSGLTDAEFLNSADEAEIARILKDYGEEARARSIARAIVAARPVARTAELAAIVRRAAGFRSGQKSDPATRTFQAIRIHLNAELDELEEGLAAAERSLQPGGRLASPSRATRPARTDVRAGGEAGFPDGARAGGEPPVALGQAAQRNSNFSPRVEGEGAMSGRSFRSVFMVASCAGAALGCYLVSLRVASERAALESVETRIVMAQRDIRLIQTEIGTRGRLSQLERWNAGAFALSAPSANQFLGGSFELAKLVQPQHQVDLQAPVVLASAPAPEPKTAPIGQPDTDEAGVEAAPTTSALLHQASLKTGTREVPATSAAVMPRQPVRTKPADKPVAAAIPALKKSADKPGLAAAKMPEKKSVDKPQLAAAKPMTKAVRIAKADPLAPLLAKPVKKSPKDHVSGQ